MTKRNTLIPRFEEAFDAKRYGEALSIIKEIVRVAPEVSTSWLNLGATYEALKKKEEAAAAYWHASRLDPSRQGLGLAWAIMSAPRGRRRRLRPFVEAVLSDNPETRPVLVALAENSGLLAEPGIGDLLGMTA